jgi:hypothetical protein
VILSPAVRPFIVSLLFKSRWNRNRNWCY